MEKLNPSDRKYSEQHVWVKAEKGIAVLGITDFAQCMLKDIVFAELPNKGTKVEKGKRLCSLESIKSVSEVVSPVSGEVVDSNKELEKNPEEINADAFGSWLVKIKQSNEKELGSLMGATSYSKYTQRLEK